MNIDVRIYGYIFGGGAYHPACLLPGQDPADNAEISALFSYHDDDVHGLSCDACGEYIFEPVENHPFNDEGRDNRCWDCGQPSDDWLHDVAPIQNDLSIADRDRLDLLG